MIECFKSFGTVERTKDLFIICCMTGTSSSAHCFKMVVGMGSWAHELFEEALISFSTYSTETEWNDDIGSEMTFPSYCRLFSGSGNWLRIFSIFEIKNSFSSLQNICAGLSGNGVALFLCKRVLTVLVPFCNRD